jgi:peroxidase
VATIRRSKLTRSPLPSARLVSTIVLNNKSGSRPDVSSRRLLSDDAIGQFLDQSTRHWPRLSPRVSNLWRIVSVFSCYFVNKQINALTHWIDGSNVYGSTAAKARSLRDPTSGRGRMRTFISNLGRQMLPLGTCPVTCFDAGISCILVE